MVLAIQLLGVCLIAAGLLAGAGWYHLALSWWRNDVPVARQSRTVVMLTRDGLYFGREFKLAYAWA